MTDYEANYYMVLMGLWIVSIVAVLALVALAVLMARWAPKSNVNHETVELQRECIGQLNTRIKELEHEMRKDMATRDTPAPKEWHELLNKTFPYTHLKKHLMSTQSLPDMKQRIQRIEKTLRLSRRAKAIALHYRDDKPCTVVINEDGSLGFTYHENLYYKHFGKHLDLLNSARILKDELRSIYYSEYEYPDMPYIPVNFNYNLWLIGKGSKQRLQALMSEYFKKKSYDPEAPYVPYNKVERPHVELLSNTN